MATNLRQIQVKDENGPIQALTWGVASGGAATIAPGVPCKQGTSGNIVPMVDGDGSTSQRFIGIAKNTSTDTASANGTVDVWVPLPGIIYAGLASVLANANTAAKIAALMYKRVKFDLSVLATNQWTVDTADADSTTNGIVIIGGEYQTSTIYFMFQSQATFLNNPTT